MLDVDQGPAVLAAANQGPPFTSGARRRSIRVRTRSRDQALTRARSFLPRMSIVSSGTGTVGSTFCTGSPSRSTIAVRKIVPTQQVAESAA